MKSRATYYLPLIIISFMVTACGNAVLEATPTPVADIADPADVVISFWDAYAAKDLDLALSFVADDFKCRGSCYFGGKASLRLFLQGYLDGGFETMISEIAVDGDMVSYKVEVHRNGLLTSQGFSDESMQVRDGLIFFWENLRP